MLFRNDKDRIEIAQLRDYTGADEYMKILAGYYQDVQSRFFSKGLPVIFAHPKIKKGNKIIQNQPALAQEDIPWKSYVRTTKNGSEILRYCLTNNPKPFGGFDFLPTHCKVTAQRWSYTEVDIDKILALMNTDHYKKGIISIVDDEALNKKKAEGRGKSSLVNFHIFSEGGDLFNNEKKLNDFCQSWGISIKGKFPDQKKNELADCIELAEKNHHYEYGFDAFRSAINDNDAYFEIRRDVQDSIDKGVIKFDKTKYQVLMQNGEVLLRIPIDRANNWKQVLYEYLAKNPDRLEVLATSNESAPTHELRKIEVEGDIDEKYITNASYPDLKILYKEISGLGFRDLNKMKKEELKCKICLNG